MSQLLIAVILSLLLGIQPVTTDLYLPALPALTEGFGASMSQAQLTLTALLLAFGISQLIWGPLSDRFGRRPILLIGLSAYVLASIGSSNAATMDMLIIWRTIQGVSMGAGVMCARAIVRDLYSPLDGARVMSQALTGLGMIACLCAPLGGILSDTYSWRVALLALAVFSSVSLGLILWKFQETLPKEHRNPLSPSSLIDTSTIILRNPTFLTYTALSSASYGGLFTFLASSSFIFIQVIGISKTEYGFVMFYMTFIYVLGTITCRRFLIRFGVQKSVGIAGLLTLIGGSSMGIFALLDWHSVLSLMGPFSLFIFAHGIHLPCSQAGAVSPFPKAAGTASALNGFAMMITAFGIGLFLGSYMNGSVYPLALGVWFWSVLISLTAWTFVKSYGKVHAT